MTSADPFSRAICDFHLDRKEEPLFQCVEDEVLEHSIERFYFGEFTAEDEAGEWLESWLDGPLLDMGAGVGQHARYFQERFETVAIEVSEPLVETMRERGVADARHADMFALTETFERNRFRSAFAHGTQLGLAGSMAGLRQFLDDLACVTTFDATAVLDGNDPERERAEDLFGYRADPTPGLAYRVMHFEYEGDASETLLFRLFSLDRLAEAATAAGWEVADVLTDSSDAPSYYRVALTKS